MLRLRRTRISWHFHFGSQLINLIRWYLANHDWNVVEYTVSIHRHRQLLCNNIRGTWFNTYNGEFETFKYGCFFEPLIFCFDGSKLASLDSISITISSYFSSDESNENVSYYHITRIKNIRISCMLL